LRIFRPKKDKVTEGWRKLRNEELHDLYSPPSKMRIIKLKMRMVGHEERRDKLIDYGMESQRERNHYQDLDMKMDLGEFEWGSLYWICLAQDWDKWTVLVNAVMSLWVP
jgi:hypothetical protein